MQRATRKLPKFPERIKPKPGKKDTKKWCKGVIGRLHKMKWVPWPQTSGKYYEVEQCQVCFRQLKLRRIV